MTKTCPICQQSKPAEDFHRKSRQCKPCRAAWSAEKYQQNRGAYAERKRAWEMANPDKVKAMRSRAKKAWRAANPEKYRAEKAAYRSRKAAQAREARRPLLEARAEAEHTHAAEIEARRQWRIDNADMLAAQRKEKERSRQKARRESGEMGAKRAFYKAAVAQRGSLLTPEKEAQIAALYAEAQRLSKETGVPHHVDHVVPLRGKTASGLHIPENMRIIPASDNLKKGSKVDPSLALHGFTEAWF